MFRPMRRGRQALTVAQCEDILLRGSHGVLALTGDEGWPYAVPMSYVYHEGTLYFHSARSGHKLDALRADDRGSFCVVDRDDVVSAEFTTYYRSAVAFGRVRELEGEELERALVLLCEKYAPGEPRRDEVIRREQSAVCMLALTVEHLTGKQAVELLEPGT